MGLPGAVEKISHGEPTFFIKNGVFAMFANNHHGDGHVAVWLPAAAGLQSFFMDASPKVYYRPPYVGSAGWIGVELDQIDTKELTARIHEAWQLIENKKKKR
ncbi:MAG: MmcQ/YjbR family DNA-binding protein [Rhodospirillaceae bacterium]|nr:MmcQ/YjbR family DNA-binding protein [Rhodospirillaceae bacterium]